MHRGKLSQGQWAGKKGTPTPTPSRSRNVNISFLSPYEKLKRIMNKIVHWDVWFNGKVIRSFWSCGELSPRDSRHEHKLYITAYLCKLLKLKGKDERDQKQAIQ